MNLFDRFSEMVDQQPEQPLIIGPAEERCESYGQVYHQIEQLIAQLKTNGITAGDTVGLHYTSGPDYIYWVYAIWGCGACVVPIPTELTASEKAQIFQTIRLETVISQANLNQELETVPITARHLLSDEVTLIRVEPLREHPADFSRVNAAFVRFSSGTTGTAKGVVLSHETILKRVEAANELLQIGSGDRILWMLSMAYHFVVTIVSYLTFGATIVFCGNHFGITILRTAIKHRVTIIYGAPTHYELMTHTRGSDMLPDSVRLAIATTTALHPDVGRKFYERFSRALNETYGIIEIGLPCINLEKPWQKRGSVGQLLPAYEMTLKDMGDGSDLKGIYVRGQGIVDAYYHPWQPRQEILAQHEGWFFTGDLGYFDDEGYLYIQGRSKEVISVGGMKFFPQEVEAVLEQHPAIKEACVYGYHDKRLGEIPQAQLVKQSGVNTLPTEEELNEFCLQYLATYKIPKQFIFVDELARTASGKVIRNAEKLSNGVNR